MLQTKHPDEPCFHPDQCTQPFLGNCLGCPWSVCLDTQTTFLFITADLRPTAGHLVSTLRIAFLRRKPGNNDRDHYATYHRPYRSASARRVIDLVNRIGANALSTATWPINPDIVIKWFPHNQMTSFPALGYGLAILPKRPRR